MDKICVICGKKFKEWGNNPWPLAENGQCCNKCNEEEVIPARILLACSKREEK